MYSLMQISVENSRTMILTRNIIFLLFICVTNIRAHSLGDLESNDLNGDDHGGELLNNDDIYSSLLKDNLSHCPDVIVNLIYEVHCPYCIKFYLNQFAPVVKTVRPYFFAVPLPFGNAKMINNKGKVEVKCQHGPAECYGNKLHACSFVLFRNETTSLMYNACLMNSTDGLGSDDKSADRCGKLMNIDPEPIKECAKGGLGEKLLIIVGKISKKYKYSHVPYVLINNKVYDVEGNDFKKHICAAIPDPPPTCKNSDN